MSNRGEDADIIGDYQSCISPDIPDTLAARPTNNISTGVLDDYNFWLGGESAENKNDGPTYSETDLIFEDNIPCSMMEEVVTDYEVETFNENVDYDEVAFSPHPRSILLPQREVKWKQTCTVKLHGQMNRSLLKSNHGKLKILKPSEESKPPSIEPPANTKTPSQPSSSTHDSKFRQTLNVKPPTNFVLNEFTMKIFKNKIRAIQKRKAQAIAREKKQKPKKVKPVKTNVTKKVQVKKPQPVIYIPQKLKPLDPKYSGEIVRVMKDENDDIEVDILSNSEEEFPTTAGNMNGDNNEIEIEEIKADEADDTSNSNTPDSMNESSDRKIVELSETDHETFATLESFEIPQSELIMDASSISNLERFMHPEFFAKRPTKTIERYLKIRSHIIIMWNSCKPLYLTKTSARNGLKKCGDVNCISRIHTMLEQIGAINFGCFEVSYVRPLKLLYESFQQNISSKNQKNGLSADRKVGANAESENGGALSEATSSDSMINRIKSRTIHRTQFELVECQHFTKDNVAPFTVSISLSCLFSLYFHALSSKMEVMGFLGGFTSGCDTLSLMRYKPCRTSDQTAINCEMCPVSQVEQTTNMKNEGFELLGWFHSHPSFPPIPSRTDLKTQTEMQIQFASNNPFIGFILSCVDMQFKCIYMQLSTAYELDVEIIKDYADVKEGIRDVMAVIESDDGFDEIGKKFTESCSKLLRDLSIPDNIDEIVNNFI